MTEQAISYPQWRARYGVPATFRDDGRAPDWRARMFAIREATPMPGDMLEPGEHLCLLTRAVNPVPFDGGWLIASIRFPVKAELADVLNHASDAQLERIWWGLREAGARPEVCVAD